MKTKTSLLKALRSYRPRENHDPLENFITEAFAWLLRNHLGFGRFYLNKIRRRLQQSELPVGLTIEWTTQLNLGGVFPDLVGLVGKEAYLFEHKAWSPLHENQLDNYRREGSRAYGEQNYRLTLVVGSRQQLDQDPDLGLCWHDVHAWIAEWQTHADYQPDHLFADFQALLESEGLGPPAPVSHESILAYRSAKGFESTLSALVQRTSHHAWNRLFETEVVTCHLPWHRGLPGGQDPWGRIGLNLLGDIPQWSPGLFVGFLVDPADHRVEWLNPACPDFGVIFDVNIGLHPDYERLEVFGRLKSALAMQMRQTCADYEMLDHLAQSPNPNRWHPFHLRKPMLELLRGTRTGDEQEERFIREATRLVKAITACTQFQEFREALRHRRI
jgi:hypothetical protein